LKENVVQLESSLVEKQNEILFLEEEVRSLRLKLAKRDSELMKQDRELNKLRVIPFFLYLRDECVSYCQGKVLGQSILYFRVFCNKPQV